MERHRGEILGVNRDEGSFTLRNVTPEGKAMVVLHVTSETRIENAGDGSTMSFSDLAAGQRASVTARKEGTRRVAITVDVRLPKKGSK